MISPHMVRQLLIAMLLVLSFPLLAQNIGLQIIKVGSVRNTGEVLEAVEQQTHLKFAYQAEIVSLAKGVNWNEQELPIETVLDRISAAQGLSYRILGRQVILSPAEEASPPELPSSNFTLSGFVTDSSSGERLIGATILEPNRQTGTATNEYGYFAINLTAGRLRLRISYLGYDDYEGEIDLNRDTRLDIALNSAGVNLGEVVVMATTRKQDQNTMSSVPLDLAAMRKMPALAGETDVLRNLQLLPGIATGSEGSAGLFVRGGSPDQNLIIADGVPLYNVSHLFGFLSVFNSDALHHVDVVKGGFPARYGGRLSSVIDVTLKEGNSRELHGNLTAGVVTSKFSLEGPLADGKMSFFLSGRRSFMGELLRPITRQQKRDAGNDGFSTYYFYDLNAKINYRLSDKDRLYLSFYQGRDDYRDQTTIKSGFAGTTAERFIEGDINWGNRIAALRWNHLSGPRLFSNLTLFVSQYDFQTEQADSLQLSGGRSSRAIFGKGSLVRDWGVKLDFHAFPRSGHNLRWGLQSVAQLFRQDFDSFQRTDTNTAMLQFCESTPAWNSFLYIEDDIDFNPRWGANVGLHGALYSVEGSHFTALQPRVSLRWKASENSALKAGFATMTQFLHLLSNSGIGLPTDLWIGATPDIGPQQAWQAGITYELALPKGYELSVETYYKDMDGLVEYREGSSFFLNAGSVADNLTTGSGQSYGAEFMLAKRSGRANGWLAYTWSKSDRTFPELNQGRTFPFTYDRRHDLSIVVNQQLPRNWQLSCTWVYASGRATTLPASNFTDNSIIASPTDVNVALLIDYSDRNAYRFKPYHRLDVGLTHEKKIKWGVRTLNFSLYNAYNRLNTFYIRAELNGDPVTSATRFTDETLFPIIPGIAYGIVF